MTAENNLDRNLRTFMDLSIFSERLSLRSKRTVIEIYYMIIRLS